ncbi:MAG: hypothetical protein E6G58_11955 [Actinobacteria bacterium]|nr:MAG: hypothetical protein E6G58_11955 [Actinomycetota bacterium]
MGHDLTTWWAPALAFLGGIVSFASPCVLPLVPGYVSFVSGVAATPKPGPRHLRGRLLPMILFVLGFGVVFTLLGAASATWVPRLEGPVAQKVSKTDPSMAASGATVVP